MRGRAVFDTNILIDFSFQNPQAQDIVRQYPARVISIVTWIEFLTGIPEHQQQASRSFLEDMFDIIYPEEDIYERTLDLRRKTRIKLPDAMIYATAKSQGVQLITRNTKDFDPSWDDVCKPY